ncbi:MAG: zinc ribbon domain-containing protein [Methanoregula sp.]|nr:zinc ribbon domain-containing protein [Methanoregula sp.]
MKLPGSKKKKTVYCPRCNAPVPPDIAFCEACGARVSPPPACSLCGTLLEPGSRFCPSCGTMVGSSKDHHPHNDDVRDNEPSMDTPEPPDLDAAPVRKPKPTRAKKPKAPAPASEEKTPDPLMMIPEPDHPGPAVEPDVPEQEAPPKRDAPVPPSAVTTLPSSGRRMRIPSGIGRRKSAVIAGVIIIIVIAALVFFGIVHIPVTLSPGGNTVQPATEMPTPEVTKAPPAPDAAAAFVPVTTAEVISLIPGPTQVPPDNFLVYFEVQRDPISKNVTVQYKGGKGQMGVRDVFVRLTRSDGQVLTGSFKPVQVDSGISLLGTEKVDRVEVIVNYHTGDSYTVIDKIFEYKIRT